MASEPEAFQGPYCAVANVLRPFMQPLSPDGTLALNLVDIRGRRLENAVLKKDERIIPHLVVPAFPSSLTVDYFSSDGELTHIYPRPEDRMKIFPSSATVDFGLPGYHTKFPPRRPSARIYWSLLPPSTPLFVRPRPDSDDVKTYLPALQQALASAARAGDSVAINAIIVHTHEK